MKGKARAASAPLADAFAPSLRKGLARVVHCATRESLYLPYVAGKVDPKTGAPKGYRVEFAPGDGREFDAEGRPWHDEKAAMRQWSMVPEGATLEGRATAERERLGLVPDFERAAEAVRVDRARAAEEVPVVNAKGNVVMKKRSKSLGLPKAKRAAAQVILFDVAPCPTTVLKKKEQRAEAKRLRAAAKNRKLFEGSK